MIDPASIYRYQMDQALALPSILGVSQYQSYLITITNDQISSSDPSNQKVVVETRLTVADGYRCNVPGFYLNPMVKQMQGEQIVLSNGQLTNNLLLLGPFVFPYCWRGCSFGTDPQIFQPASHKTSNIQVYLQIKGLGLSPKGNFFEIKEIKIDDMSNLSYQLVLEATKTRPQL